MPRTTKPEILMDGLTFVESARWYKARFWFSDWGTQQIIAIDVEGQKQVAVRVSVNDEKRDKARGPLCFDFLPDGRLLIVAGREGRLLIQQKDGTLATYADLTSLSPFPWNDVVVDLRGNTYIGNTGFDFPGGEFAPGIIALVGRNGSVRQVAKGLAFPNGMAVTPDNSTLIVAESYGQKLTAFSIADDGSLHNRRVWAVCEGYPDGICLDPANAVWYADVPNKRCVRVREGGEVLDTLNLCFSCALGGPDGKTLVVLTAEWHGARKMFEGPPTGQAVAVRI
jgi:sugar lactone lactonase YvrE